MRALSGKTNRIPIAFLRLRDLTHVTFSFLLALLLLVSALIEETKLMQEEEPMRQELFLNQTGLFLELRGQMQLLRRIFLHRTKVQS